MQKLDFVEGSHIYALNVFLETLDFFGQLLNGDLVTGNYFSYLTHIKIFNKGVVIL
jgi:hypothetical protein